MKVAFIILAHCGPEQVARLVARLAPHYVFVHIDLKVAEDEFNQFAKLLSVYSHVKLLPRKRSAWASWNLVEAALGGLVAAMNQDDWSHIMLLSGQDYALVSATDMSLFFHHHKDNSFVPHWNLPSQLWGTDGGLSRIRYWHQSINGRKFRMPIPRRHPEGITSIGGTMYWCLTRQVAAEVLSFTERNPEVVNFYQHVWIPDELYIQTVVMNSQYADSVLNEALTYTRWSRPGSASPDNLSLVDGSALIRASLEGSNVGGWGRRKLFARKIDATDQSELLDFLDQAV